MTYDHDDLAAARDAGILDTPTHDRLDGFLRARAAARPVPAAASTPEPAGPKFDLVHLLWYSGALIIMTGMGVFSTLTVAAFGADGIIATGVLYLVGFLIVGDRLWRKGLTTPGGLLIAVAVSMVPLVIFGIQQKYDLWALAKPGEYQDFFKQIHGSWLWMEVGAIVAAVIALMRYPFGFISVIAAIALWFMSMDIVIFLKTGELGWAEQIDLRRDVSMVFGLAMMAVGWVLDLRRQRRTDYGFWMHLFGALAFWNGLTWREPSTEMAAALYCALNVGLLLLSVYLGRRVYAVFGTMGIALYLGHLAYKTFKDVYSFTFALTLIGIAIIWLGIVVQKNAPRLATWFDENLPATLKALRPRWGE